MSDKAPSDRGVGTVGPAKKRGCAGHYKRFWWAHLLALAVVTAVVVPCIILVAVPRIAQKKMDEAQLEVRSISALKTESQNYTMGVDSVIRTDGSQHATVAAFEGDMYLEDWPPQRPFARLSFPQTTSDSYSEVNISQFTSITDMDAFTVFNTWLLVNDSLRVTVKGDTSVRVRGIDRNYPVTFKKTVTMPGLRLFEGTQVQNPSVSLEKDAQGNNFKGTVVIPNHSLVTFEIGNATFHNYVAGAEIGTVQINNMLLRPGNNTFPMQASVDQGPVLAALGKPPSCETGIVPFQLRGKDVVNNGQHLSYYADALGSANQTVDINIGAALKKSLNFTTSCSS